MIWMLLEKSVRQAVTSAGFTCCPSPAAAVHISLYSSEETERFGALSLMNWFHLGRVCHSGVLRFDFLIAVFLFHAIIRKVNF